MTGACSTSIWAGTSGYSYKEWKGTFYPSDLKDRDMLEYYSRQLPAVEINNTFYRMPKASVLAAWRDSVPADFRFVIKASRRITHIKRLNDVEEELGFLCGNLEVLAEHLGCVLFQLPSNSKQDVDRLQSFLDLIPLGTRCAFEFRHESWFSDEVYSCLREANCAICHVDTEEGVVPREVVPTTSWGYFRLRRPDYRQAELVRWFSTIASQPWEEAFVFFKHEDAGAGPQLARRFLEVAQVPARQNR
jgi:uncharacterized protein YecE (DUF72 family)